MKAIYIGAGIDTKPFNIFRNIKRFDCFDSQPNSAFGTLQSKSFMPDGSNGYSRPNFIPILDSKMKEINFELINVKDNIRTYSNNDQTVYYHTNVAIPEHYENIKNNIRNFDTLIVAGHDPDSIFLDATRKKIHFIGFEETCYHNSEHESKNSILYRIHNDNIQHMFNSYSYYYKNKVYEFNTWSGFYDFYLN